MSQCNYIRLPDGRWSCVRCLRVTRSTPEREPRGQCKVRGLGDYVKSALEMVGVTKKRWNRIRRAIGLSKPCGCSQRQEVLNKLGDELAGR